MVTLVSGIPALWSWGRVSPSASGWCCSTLCSSSYLWKGPSLACGHEETARTFYKACFVTHGLRGHPPRDQLPLVFLTSVQDVITCTGDIPHRCPTAASGLEKPGVLKFQTCKFYLYFSFMVCVMFFLGKKLFWALKLQISSILKTEVMMFCYTCS